MRRMDKIMTYSDFYRTFVKVHIIYLLVNQIQHFEGRQISTINAALDDDETQFKTVNFAVIRFNINDFNESENIFNKSIDFDVSIGGSVLKSSNELYIRTLQTFNMNSSLLLSRGLGNSYSSINEIQTGSEERKEQLNIIKSGFSTKLKNDSTIPFTTETPMENFFTLFFSTKKPKIHKIKSLEPNYKDRLTATSQPERSKYTSAFSFKPDVPLLPGFYSLTGISPKIVEVNVSGPTQLECSSVHRYCSFPNHPLREALFECSCIEECLQYGDCCWDAPVQLLLEGQRTMNCVAVRNKDNSFESFYMMSRCLMTWRNYDIQLLCEDSNQRSADEFLKLPVTSLVSNVTYQNIYCAVCNEDIKVTFWKSHLINCPLDDFTNMTSDQRLSCRHAISLPVLLSGKPIANPKSCDDSVISDCPNWWLFLKGSSGEAKQIHERCLSYYAPVMAYSGGKRTVYKNKFCAFCNGINVKKLSCSFTKHLEGDKTEGVPIPSYSLLMDIDFTNGGGVIGRKETCPRFNVYDPWKNVCRSVFCEPLVQNKNLFCNFVTKSDLTSDDQLELQSDWLNSTLTLNCTKIAVYDQDFIVNDNSTVTLLASKKKLEVGEYEPLTTNTILICDLKKSYILKFGETHGYLSVTCLTISLVCLSVKISMHFFLSEDKNLSARIVLFLSISIFAAQLLFLFGIHKTELPALCSFVAILMHYFFLASFFWANVLAFDIWKTFSSLKMVNRSYSVRQYWKYSAYGWLTPMVIVLIAVFFNWFKLGSLYPGYGDFFCWISNRLALLVFFAVPLGLLLVPNLIFYTFTVIKIIQTDKTTTLARENTDKKDRVRFFLYIKLALIMGLTWIFGFISAYANSDILWYFFIIFNGLQGMFILLALTQLRIPRCLFRVRTWRSGRFFRAQRVKSKPMTVEFKSSATQSLKLKDETD